MIEVFVGLVVVAVAVAVCAGLGQAATGDLHFSPLSTTALGFIILVSLGVLVWALYNLFGAVGNVVINHFVLNTL